MKGPSPPVRRSDAPGVGWMFLVSHILEVGTILPAGTKGLRHIGGTAVSKEHQTSLYVPTARGWLWFQLSVHLPERTARLGITQV